MKKTYNFILYFIIIVFGFVLAKLSYAQSLESVINSKNRTPSYVERDKYRNPLNTLSFFKLKNNMKVIELQPSGGNSPGGWYTEIQMAVLSMPPIKLNPDNSVDMVLTFRNLHNWLKAGYLKEVFEVSFNALKPGGIFGVVEHRAPDNFTIDEMNKSGYVSEKIAIQYAQSVGFILEEKAEINANPLDTKDHKYGVWTLPPTLKLADTNARKKYMKIGERYRMTLRFVKPNN